MKKTAIFLAAILILNLIGANTVFASVITDTSAGYGDANFNGKVNAEDSAFILSHVLSSDIYVDEAMSDVNADGDISSVDAAMVLQKTLLSTFVFPKEQADPYIDPNITTVKELPYGIYTKPFVFGDITVSASALEPVVVKDIYLYSDYLMGTRYYDKVMILGSGNALNFNTEQSDTTGVKIEFRKTLYTDYRENLGLIHSGDTEPTKSYTVDVREDFYGILYQTFKGFSDENVTLLLDYEPEYQRAIADIQLLKE